MDHGRLTERGASAVEFALIALPLFYLVIAIIDYGVMLGFRQAVSQSAAEGARAGAVTPAGGDVTGNAVAAVTDSLGHGLTCAPPSILRAGTVVGACTVSVADCGNAGSTCVFVQVQVDYGKAGVTPDIPLVPMPHQLHYTAVSEVGA